MQATRAYDALYDSTYTVSAQQDHYREQTRAGGISLGRVPQYDNLFSALGHHPAQTFRYKTHDKLPSHVPRGHEQHQNTRAENAAVSVPEVVSGSHRYLYSRRPLLVPGLYHPDIYSLHMLPEAAEPDTQLDASADQEGEEAGSRTIATQSDYRESEAQTTPWDVDYILPDQPTAKQQYLSAQHHCQGPELLALRDLKLGNGLPVGLSEVEEIEKRRVKRAFEAALPPLDDLQRLPLRQQLLEAWEAQEWADREANLEATQDAKLLSLEASLQQREEQIENHHAERISALRRRRSREVQHKLAYVHRQRVSTILHIEDAQRLQRNPDRACKPDIIDKYSRYSSGVYAPLQREGRFPDTRPADQGIDTRPYQPTTYSELLELEASLPKRHLLAKVQAPGSMHKLNYLQHREEKVAADLDLIAGLLSNSRENGTIGDMGASYNTPGSMKMASKTMTAKMSTTSMMRRTARSKSRTDMAAPSRALLLSAEPGQVRKDAAAMVLQRLLRGRAMQTKMYEGLQSKLALIRELQMKSGTPDGEEARLRRPESRTQQELTADSLVGSATSEILRVMAEPDTDKKAEMLNAIDMRRGASLSRQSDTHSTDQQTGMNQKMQGFAYGDHQGKATDGATQNAASGDTQQADTSAAGRGSLNHADDSHADHVMLNLDDEMEGLISAAAEPDDRVMLDLDDEMEGLISAAAEPDERVMLDLDDEMEGLISSAALEKDGSVAAVLAKLSEPKIEAAPGMSHAEVLKAEQAVTAAQLAEGNDSSALSQPEGIVIQLEQHEPNAEEDASQHFRLKHIQNVKEEAALSAEQELDAEIITSQLVQLGTDVDGAQ